MLGIFLDIETTGLNSLKHRSIDLALKVIELYTGDLKADFETIVFQPKEVFEKSDPTSLLINGFTWNKLLMGLSEQEVSQRIIHLFQQLEIKRGSAVFICQNPSFDRAFFSQIVNTDIQESLKWPYHWLDFASMYWALNVREMIEEQSLIKIGLSKDDIAKSYGLPPEQQPHRAMNGVNHLIECYKYVVGFPLRSTIN